MKFREYLQLALPLTISTITQPLLGAVDTAVVGRLEDSVYLGGVAVGAVIFSTIYWLFGFLRINTSAYSAQALGSQKKEDKISSYFMPAVIAFFLGLSFLILQLPIFSLAQKIMDLKTVDVMEQANIYYRILIWGAPMVLIGYVNLGWLMGQKKIKQSMFLQISANILNIILDILFVHKWGMKVEGVAYATLISQCFSFAVGLFWIHQELHLFSLFLKGIHSFRKSAVTKFFIANTDLMIRTICLLTMTNMFVSKGSDFGNDILAANSLLFQIQYIISYFFDGFGNASSILAGESKGKKDKAMFRSLMKVSNQAIVGVSLFLFTVISIYPKGVISIFTSLPEIQNFAEIYYFWIQIFPFIIGVGLVYYAIFIGISNTSDIRNSMLFSLSLFLLSYYYIIPRFENHGLWLSFLIFSFGRSIYLFICIRKKNMLKF
ncbi:MATE family efflux transporter [Fusobacterium necrophorum]|uniref:MATE family efflux transporter n=1 Tax=Fusobacterium necrophorum TaxID=859 RepID=UPI00370E6C5A